MDAASSARHGAGLPFSFTVALYGLELGIAFIQAYIFTILTCVYMGDAFHPH